MNIVFLNSGTRFLSAMVSPIGLAFAFSLIFVHAAQADAPLSEDRVKELAIEAILEKPEIIEEALQRLRVIEEERRAKRIADTLTDRGGDLFQDSNAPVLGNPQGDVTIVEFFDYNCPFCKRAVEPVKALLASDTNIRLVYREWPILSPGSMFAAQAALAAREQGKYEEMHWALMTGGRADEISTLKVARDLGLDIDKLRADMQKPEVASHIQLSMDLAKNLGINGTPSFVVAGTVVPGLVPLERLQELVEVERKAKGKPE